MVNLIIASESKEAMHNWVYALESIYPVVFPENIAAIYADVEKVQYDENALLVLDASLINETYQLSYFCQYVKKVLVVGEGFNPRQQIQLIFDGACGYSDKAIDPHLILRAIEAVLNNEIWLERQLIPQVLKGVVAQQYLSKTKDILNENAFKTLSILTRREIEVIEHIYKGEDNLTISTTLKISIRTVKAHLTAIFRKLQVQDRFQLVVFLKDLHVDHLSNDKPSDRTD